MSAKPTRYSSFLPFVETLREYNLTKGRADFFAGLTVAIVAAPQAMAYALIAGFSPIYGLYAAVFPVIITALFSSSRYIVAGPTNALCMLIYSAMAQIYLGNSALQALPETNRIQFLLVMTIAMGFTQVLAGFLRFGKFTKAISHSVLLAFTSCAYLLIILGQLKTFLGLNFVSPHNAFALLNVLWQNLGEINIFTLAIALLTLVLLELLRKVFPNSPYALITLILTSGFQYFFNLTAYGVENCPSIPRALPSLFIPSMGLLQEMFTHRLSFALPILTLAMIASVESITIAKAMAKERGENFSSNKELIAGGLGNVFAGFSFALPSCGSFSRSAVNYANNAQTCFASIFSALFVLLFILLFGGFVSFIPLASLSALLVYICWNMLKFKDVFETINTSKNNATIFFGTALSVFLLGLAESIFVGVFLTLVLGQLAKIYNKKSEI